LSYERLRIIYTKAKDFDAAIRVCTRFLEVFGEKPNDKCSNFEKHIEKLTQKKQKEEQQGIQ